MNKKELIAAHSGGMTKVNAGQALNVVLTNIAGAMEKGERVTLSGFGCFKVVERATKRGRNPRTGEPLIIPAHNTVKFRPGKNLNSRVE
jgi:DNA-binding protein HU-beta